MKIFEKCDWRCAAILTARKNDSAPLVWNSLTHEEQKMFDAHPHPHPSRLGQFGSWFRRLMLLKKSNVCPTCGRP